MLLNAISASAPATVMLLGEYAVLYGGPAIVAAINRRLTVTLLKRKDNKVIIRSDSLGNYQTTKEQLTPLPPFSFVLAILQHYQDQLHHGFELRITADFLPTLGIGSSAAVTVAMLRVVYQLLHRPVDYLHFIAKGIAMIRNVQGLGSGADIAASVLGGIVVFSSKPSSAPFMPVNAIEIPPPALTKQQHAHKESAIHAEKLPLTTDISLVYCGKKTPTVEVVKKVTACYRHKPQLYQQLITAIAKLANDGCGALRKKNWQDLGLLFNKQQQLMRQLGVSNQRLEDIVNQSQQLSGIYGAKISGAGLGDCVVTLGKLPDKHFPINTTQHRQGVRQLAITIATKGVSCETT